mmetsp:Transcript_14233/g.17929  ORF Transcript_14233/g.17929 Transcript_14233/m.17929 type:complete len:181 (-) Transcript_14233:700-1242(-)|eukprot:CAMPEP_0172500428 /NCGR_PEP_ID=MMETSP1066-20121228/138104_1 /TAXON_ID=671091 /ORGANISM="Coscinodiscus wailesii, Strain CCMP2513" /LENGTH=180 /DNA_ID=CAMNT_0013274649 /DNA_START=237 /DNA_END=779 /DNA_ORIENTATION=+
MSATTPTPITIQQLGEESMPKRKFKLTVGRTEHKFQVAVETGKTGSGAVHHVLIFEEEIKIASVVSYDHVMNVFSRTILGLVWKNWLVVADTALDPNPDRNAFVAQVRRWLHKWFTPAARDNLVTYIKAAPPKPTDISLGEYYLQIDQANSLVEYFEGTTAALSEEELKLVYYRGQPLAF